MASQLTSDQAQEFLKELGYSLPGFVVDAILCRVNGIDACLDGAGYDDCAVMLIKSYSFGLIALSSGARRIKSQSAGDVSRSFDYGQGSAYTQLLNNLRALDTSGCADAIIPADPDNKGDRGMFVAGDCAYS